MHGLGLALNTKRSQLRQHLSVKHKCLSANAFWNAGGEWANFNPMWPRKQRFDMYGPNLLHTPRPDLLNVMLMELRNPYFTLPVSDVHPEA